MKGFYLFSLYPIILIHIAVKLMVVQERQLDICWVLGHILYFFVAMWLEIQPLPLVAPDVVVKRLS